MNLVLLQNQQENSFPRGDYRYTHLSKILKVKKQDTLQAGIIGGPLGIITIKEHTAEFIGFQFSIQRDPNPPLPIKMLVGTPRPPVAKRLIKDLGAWPVQEIHFVNSQLTEKSYLKSNLWIKDEYKQAQLEGASQGKTTFLPKISLHNNIYSAIHAYQEDKNPQGIIFHNSPKLPYIKTSLTLDQCLWIAIGPERGWTDQERQLLIDKGFKQFQLGDSVLRTEVACHVVLGIVTNRMV